MAMTQRKFGRKGFSLIEVIVAISIISVAMLALVPLLTASYRTDTQTTYRVKAQYLVTQQLDNLLVQANNCTTVSAASAGVNFIDALTGQTVANANASPVVISLNWTVAAADVNNLCRITSTATYTDQGGGKTFTLASQKGPL